MKEKDIVSGYIMMDNRELYIENGGKRESVDSCITHYDNIIKSCDDELGHIMTNCSIYDLKKKNRGSSKLYKEFANLEAQLCKAKTIKDLNRIYNRINHFLKTVSFGTESTYDRNSIGNYFDRMERLAEMNNVYERDYEYLMPSGQNINELRRAFIYDNSRAAINVIMRKYINNIYNNSRSRILLLEKTKLYEANLEKRKQAELKENTEPSQKEENEDFELYTQTLKELDRVKERLNVLRYYHEICEQRYNRLIILRDRGEKYVRKDDIDTYDYRYPRTPKVGEETKLINSDIDDTLNHITRMKKEIEQCEEYIFRLEEKARLEMSDSTEEKRKDERKEEVKDTIKAAKNRFYGMGKVSKALARITGNYQLLEGFEAKDEDSITDNDLKKIGGMFK